MPLTSPRFRDNARLQRAAENNPSLKPPERGQAVRLVQQALLDCGIALPRSTARYGSPDGIYGAETEAGVRSFQHNHRLKTIDGHAGHDTLYKLDSLFPMHVPPLPPLPGFTPDGRIYYRVPGLIEPRRQPSPRSCWAACYTMMLSWRRGASIPIEAAVDELGEPFRAYFITDSGLPVTQAVALAHRARLQAEPLFSAAPEGVLEMLQRCGLLFKGYAWMVMHNGNPVYGRHAIVLYAIEGDGSGNGTVVFYLDPGDGMRHSMSFAQFAADGERDMNLLIPPGLTAWPLLAPDLAKQSQGWADTMLRKYTEIMHY